MTATQKPKRGEIWLLRFPFTNLTSSKVWPALILSEHGNDFIVLGIFSRIPSGILKETWVLIDSQASYFKQAGLKKTSLVNTEKIAVIHRSVFQRQLGSLSTDVMSTIDIALKKSLKLN
ncbi:MAG: type II toxin-antitoxin system PemK/MazF family toxin [Candidatus Poribacteria bacterium]|nr:type II toxin-antitoxin system PemK/MazF family toxin [Candidatus Poribacteria bacterium]